jgi:hypothetical protein
MRTSCFVLTIIALILFNSGYTQEKVEYKNIEHALQFEFTSPINSYCINYNRIFANAYKAKPYLGLGLQFFPHSKSQENVFMVNPQVGLFVGTINALEVNIGASIDLKYGEHMPSLYLGYRYFSKNNPLSFKIGLTMFYLGKSEAGSFLNLPTFFPTPTLALGFTL